MADPNKWQHPSANWSRHEDSSSTNHEIFHDSQAGGFNGASGYSNDGNWSQENQSYSGYSQPNQYYYEEGVNYSEPLAEHPSQGYPPHQSHWGPEHGPAPRVDLSQYTEEELRLAWEQKMRIQAHQYSHFPPPQSHEMNVPPPHFQDARFIPPQAQHCQGQVYPDQWHEFHMHQPPPYVDGYPVEYHQTPIMPPQKIKQGKPKKRHVATSKRLPIPEESESEESSKEDSEQESTSSENEEEEVLPPKKIAVSSKSKSTKGKTGKELKAKKKRKSENSGENSSEGDDCLLPKPKALRRSKTRRPVSVPTPTKKRLGIVKNVQQLQDLGTFVAMNNTNPEYGFIKQYLESGFGHIGPLPRIKVHLIYELSQVSPPAAHAPAPPIPQGIPPAQVVLPKQIPPKASPQPGTGPATSIPCDILLWSKTTLGSVKAISSQKPGCSAYYDKSVRALSLKVSEIRGSFRQILLLSSVSLGNMEKSKEGFSFWDKTGNAGLKQGFDTVMSVGSFTPDWDECRELTTQKMMIPCGKTRRSRGSLQTSIDFNEYILFDRSRAKVMYAVDVEISP